MPTTNLPDKVPEHADDLVVFTPPTAFEVVDRGSAEPIKFEHLGDTFIGIFEGTEDVTTEEGDIITMATFTGADGKPYCCFPNAVMRRGLRKVEVKDWVRITYALEVDTGKPSPLKSYVIEVGRA